VSFETGIKYFTKCTSVSVSKDGQLHSHEQQMMHSRSLYRRGDEIRSPMTSSNYSRDQKSSLVILFWMLDIKFTS